MPDVILVVDDNRANLRLAEYLLTSAGCDVRTARSGDEALALLKSLRPAVILMDLQLPGIDGFTLTRKLKDDPATCDICIVAMTAYAMSGDDARARAAGCDGYVAKPIDPATFAAAVKKYAAGRA